VASALTGAADIKNTSKDEHFQAKTLGNARLYWGLLN
jgi:hypothetical protein